MNPLSKTPVLSLLIPLVLGIVLQYYLKIQNWSILFFCLGLGIMLLSYFISTSKQFSFRWMFGVGMTLFVIGVGILSTDNRQQESEYIFEHQQKTYKGIVLEIPQNKPKSIAYKVQLPDYDKKVVCYFQLDSLRTKLQPGDEFLFYGTIQLFHNIGDSADFDYVTYMFNQGFSGSAYVPTNLWKSTGNVDASFQTYAQRWRQSILNFYSSLGFDDTQLAILSALTVGYQDLLSDDIKQAFRTTGTIHVLSVSGLHVGIIYAMISFLLGFIKRTSKYYIVKPLLIILLLWIYAFITGLSPSVVRASIMLSMLCLGQMFKKKHNSIHAIYIAAFLILLHNPFSLFHIGFQLSFLSVLAILYLQPKASGLFKIKSKYIRYVWQSFTLSCVAQLATFPLCLYYFGTFPTYFFITNLLIVPLVMFIIYAFGGIVIAKSVSLAIPEISDYLFYIPVKLVQLLLNVLVQCIKFFEALPFSLIQDIKISFVDLLLIMVIIIASITFLIRKKTTYLKISLLATLIFLSIGVYSVVS